MRYYCTIAAQPILTRHEKNKGATSPAGRPCISKLNYGLSVTPCVLFDFHVFLFKTSPRFLRFLLESYQILAFGHIYQPVEQYIVLLLIERARPFLYHLALVSARFVAGIDCHYDYAVDFQ